MTCHRSQSESGYAGVVLAHVVISILYHQPHIYVHMHMSFI